MSLLDDARRLAEGAGTAYASPDLEGRTLCAFCAADQGVPNPFRVRPFAHDPDCPWPSMPKIVAALKAAELVTIAYEDQRILYGEPAHHVFVVALEKLDEALDA